MPHESCVAHPTRNWYFHVRLDYYGITGDHCSAAVLYLFEYLTSNTLEQMRHDGLAGDPWISISKQGISDALIGLFSPRSVLESRKALEERGFLAVRDLSVGAREYLFNYELVSQKIAEWDTSEAGKIARKKFNTYASKIARDLETPCAKLLDATAQNCALLYNEVNHSYKSTSEEIQELLSPDSQDQNLPNTEHLPEPEPENAYSAPAADSENKCDSYELRSELSIDAFVQWAYKRKGRSIDATGRYIKGKLAARANSPLRDRLEGMEQSHGQEDFRTALLVYLDREDEYLRTNEWPLNLFLKNVLEYLPEGPAPIRQAARVQPVATLPYRNPSSGPANAPAAANEINRTPVLKLVDRWNTLVPEVTCGPVPAFVSKIVEKAIATEGFEECFDSICKTCVKIHEHGHIPEVSFAWLFTSTANGPNWAQVYMGKWAWATKPKSGSGGMSAIDQAIADAEKAEREKQ